MRLTIPTQLQVLIWMWSGTLVTLRKASEEMIISASTSMTNSSKSTSSKSSASGLFATPHYSLCKVVLFPQTKVEIDQCVTFVEMNQCVGACRSVDNYPIGKGRTLCNCCQPLKFRRKLVTNFACKAEDGTVVSVSKHIHIREPTKCACKKCRPSR